MNTFVPGVLVFALLATGAGTAYEILAPFPPVESRSIAGPAPDAGSEVPEFTPPAMRSFAVINARPVFSRTRRPIADPLEIDDGDDAQTSGIELVGIMTGPGHSVALLRRTGATQATAVSPGGSFQGWQVVSIEPGQAVLRAAASNNAVTLYPVGSRTTGRTQTSAPPPQSALQSMVVAPPPQRPFTLPSTMPKPPVYRGKPGTNRRHTRSP